MARKSSASPPGNDVAPPGNDASFKVDLRKLAHTKSRCVICRTPVTTGTTALPRPAQLQLLIHHHLVADPASRVCLSHLHENNYLKDIEELDLGRRKPKDTALDKADSDKLLLDLLGFIHSHNGTPRLDFQALPESDYPVWTGWDKTSFDNMLSYVSLHTSSNRDSREGLGMFWVKLKTGLSYEQIASLFGIAHKSRVSCTIAKVSDQLDVRFVPQHLGPGHINHDEAAETHSSAYTRIFWGGSHAVLLWDGTYFYTWKSSDNELNRKTYSGYKHRHLLKTMSLVFPDGHILDALGPYPADGKHNDASLAEHILTHNTDLRKWLQADDIQVVDRGFRDSTDIFDSQKLNMQMPEYLPKGQSQHTTTEANHSRLVTKVRWVVEAYHSRLKKFRGIDGVIPSPLLSHLGAFVRIISAALNAYRSPQYTTGPEDEQLAKDMLAKVTEQDNHLAERIKSGPLSSRGRKWLSLHAADVIPDFPILSECGLRKLTCGIFQLKMAPSYLNEHLDENGEFEIQVHSEAPHLARAQIRSRHVNASRYYTLIEHGKSNATPVSSWYCSCKCGQRTIGCCVHVATVIWYLGFVRHSLKTLPRKKSKARCAMVDITSSKSSN